MNEALRTSCQVVQTSITLGEWHSAVHNKTGAEALIWPESDTRGIFKISSKKNSLCASELRHYWRTKRCVWHEIPHQSALLQMPIFSKTFSSSTLVIFLPIKKGTLEHSPILLLGLATSYLFFLDHSAPALILSTAKTSEEKSPSLRFGRKLV